MEDWHLTNKANQAVIKYMMMIISTCYVVVAISLYIQRTALLVKCPFKTSHIYLSFYRVLSLVQDRMNYRNISILFKKNKMNGHFIGFRRQVQTLI